MSRKSKSNKGKSRATNIVISVAIPIITAFILGTIDRIFSVKNWKSLRSSLHEDLQSLLENQNLQAQKDLQLLAEKKDQQKTILHTLAEESNHDSTETETDPNWHRLTLFSDGVFAIAMTLLVLDIHTPTRLNALTRLFPNILIFAYTFLYIGFFWNLHRQIFRYIKRINTKLVMFNLLVLLLIVFMPFTTSLLYEYYDTDYLVYSDAQFVGRIYASSMVLLGILFAVLWLYASGKRRLLKEHVNERTIQHYYIAILFPTLVYLITISFTFIHEIRFLPPQILLLYSNTGVDMSQIVWLILPLCLLIYNFWFVRTD